MPIRITQIPSETKWAMATKGLTRALTAHMDALYSVLGKEKYDELIRRIWTQIGEGSAVGIQEMDMKLDNAQQVGEAGVTMCICAMGPEYNIDAVESSESRTVMKITECPWKNRMTEFGITHDLLTACDTAFWKQFVKTLNPNVTMRHGKQMHRGDPYCEWIFETKNDLE
jgi:hypothetical protein